MGTNPAVVRRIMAGLRDEGYVRSEKGYGGGRALARDLAGITLRDVYEALGRPALFAMGHRTGAAWLSRRAGRECRARHGVLRRRGAPDVTAGRRRAGAPQRRLPHIALADRSRRTDIASCPPADGVPGLPAHVLRIRWRWLATLTARGASRRHCCRSASHDPASCWRSARRLDARVLVLAPAAAWNRRRRPRPIRAGASSAPIPPGRCWRWRRKRCVRSPRASNWCRAISRMPPGPFDAATCLVDAALPRAGRAGGADGERDPTQDEARQHVRCRPRQLPRRARGSARDGCRAMAPLSRWRRVSIRSRRRLPAPPSTSTLSDAGPGAGSRDPLRSRLPRRRVVLIKPLVTPARCWITYA